MNDKQKEIINLLKNGENVMMLGQAGTGKSQLIIELNNGILNNKVIYTTSTTGISALNINAITLHSFLGIGIGSGTKESLLKKIKVRPDIRKRLSINNILLIIDEISMLSSDLLDKLDFILKNIRNNNKPFGGIQLLLSGDLLQLEAINQELIYKSNNIIFFKIVTLSINYRQKNDKIFQTILDNLRENKLTKNNLEILQSINNTSHSDDNNIKIFCTNIEINRENNKHLYSIKEKEYVFNASFTGKEAYKKEFCKQFTSKSINSLYLKKNIRVMLTKNLDVSCGLVNGSLGTITYFTPFTNLPVVKFDNGVEIQISPQQWELEINGECLSVATQIPLIIAYAISVHKCQGITLDNATIDLSNAFCNHQVYVALSRVRTLKGLKLINFNIKKIKTNKETLEFYSKI